MPTFKHLSCGHSWPAARPKSSAGTWGFSGLRNFLRAAQGPGSIRDFEKIPEGRAEAQPVAGRPSARPISQALLWAALTKSLTHTQSLTHSVSQSLSQSLTQSLSPRLPAPGSSATCQKGCSLTSGRAGGPRAGPSAPDKRLDRGLTLNRSRSYSRSATYETLTQNQVVYESFGAKLFTNMKCASGGGPPSFGDPPAQQRTALRTRRRGRATRGQPRVLGAQISFRLGGILT